MRLVGSDRLRYWEANGVGEESERERIGLPREVAPGLAPAAEAQ